MSNGCEAITTSGEPCQMAPLRGERFCWNHDPAHAADRAAARKRGGRNSSRAGPVGLPVEPVRLRSVEDVRTMLEDVATETMRLANSNQRSRTLAALLGLALRTLEVGELEARLEALEEQLRTRRVA
jgi:hypothetical protein